ncbi:hypothetical protein CFP56_029120 [Quercus suber]|uniref:Uncharacterized protein n=1 Tax=Quercus suber TaxID=58331 RepID=A0AAW0MB65_QUESU
MAFDSVSACQNCRLSGVFLPFARKADRFLKIYFFNGSAVCGVKKQQIKTRNKFMIWAGIFGSDFCVTIRTENKVKWDNLFVDFVVTSWLLIDDSIKELRIFLLAKL